jgi:hypothetical protein
MQSPDDQDQTIKDIIQRSFEEMEIRYQIEELLETAADLGIEPDFSEDPELEKEFNRLKNMSDREFFDEQKDGPLPYLSDARPISRESFLEFYDEQPGAAHICHIGASDESRHIEFIHRKALKVLKEGPTEARVHLLKVGSILDVEELDIAYQHDPINTLIHAHPFLEEDFVKAKFIENRKQFHKLEIDTTPGLSMFNEYLEHELGMHPEQIYPLSELPAEPVKSEEELAEILAETPDLAIKHHHKYGDNGGPSLNKQQLFQAYYDAPATAIQYLGRQMGGEKIVEAAGRYPGAAYTALTHGLPFLDKPQLVETANHFPDITVLMLKRTGGKTKENEKLLQKLLSIAKDTSDQSTPALDPEITKTLRNLEKRGKQKSEDERPI